MIKFSNAILIKDRLFLFHGEEQSQERYMCFILVYGWPTLTLIKIVSDDGN